MTDANERDAPMSRHELVTALNRAHAALYRVLVFLNEQHGDARADALDGDPISKDARPIRDIVVSALIK